MVSYTYRLRFVVGGLRPKFFTIAGVYIMGKSKTKATEVTTTVVAEPTSAPAKAVILHVKQGLTLRGGRGEWYKLLCKFDGKPVSEFIAEGKAKPASHYTARSARMGQPKTPESRLSWFKRVGIVTLGE